MQLLRKFASCPILSARVSAASMHARFIRDHCLFKASREIADIITAPNAMFNQALGTAHITN
jgi:hypothetical protein